LAYALNSDLALIFKDDALAGTFRGRPVKQNPDTQALQCLVRWNAECEQDHECCQGPGPMPSRLIDVQGSKSRDTVKLVELDAVAWKKYTALTYTSESGIVGYWEDNTLPEDGNIRVADLPKTFQDAVLVTRTLGVQYLWIDSLCISGNPREWARDSEQAGSVYSNAYLTISATGSENVTDGLLFPRPLRNSLQIPYKTSDDIAGIVLLSTLPLVKEAIRSRYIEMEKEPISKGVWSFQERVLSRRIVHFASDQMYFECLSHFVSEEGLLERLRYHTSVEKLPDGADHYRKRAINASPLSRWFSILWDYGRRQSSTPSDKLPALSNVARAFQHMLDDEYVVGYWKKSLIESLCWQSLHCKLAGESSAPSWSWASVDGIPCVGFARSTHFTATVVNTQVSLLDDAKPFGRVTAASIELEAPLVPLRLFEKPGPIGHMYVRTDNGDEDGFYADFDTIDRHYVASAEILRDTELFALVLAETHKGECLTRDCDIGGSHRGLIVTPVNASGDRVKRLGFILASSLSFGYGELSNSRKTVTLV
jgi:hypothetical protein